MLLRRFKFKTHLRNPDKECYDCLAGHTDIKLRVSELSVEPFARSN